MFCRKMMLFFMNILVLCVVVVSADPIQYRKHDSATIPVSEDNELKDPAGDIRDFTYKGVSYKLMMKTRHFENARQACVEQGGYLVTVYSEDLNGEIVRQLKSAGSIESAWIGLIDWGRYEGLYKRRIWEWRNPYGSCNRFFNWKKGEPIDPKYLLADSWKYKRCAKINTNGGEWTTEDCGILLPSICEMAIDASQVGCSKEVIEYKGEKYKFVFKKLNFEDAKKNCEKLGGHLVTIYEKDLQDAINQQVTQSVYSPYKREVWIGYIVNQDGKWDWSNPSASCFTYTNLGKTDLKDVSRNCVLMGGNPNKVGEWGTASCSSRRPSICELGVKKDLCSEDFTYKGVSYKLMMKTRHFENAKQACVEQGGYLVTVYSEDLNGKIVRQLKSAGSIESAWIGLDDWGNYEGLYKKIEFAWRNPYGSCSRFFNWRKGEPIDPKYLLADSWKYKSCAKINTNGGEWTTEDCSILLPSICEMAIDASQIGCTKEVIEYKGEKYKFVFKKLNFEDAKKNCEKLGGHLVTIYEKDLQDAINQQVTQNVYLPYKREVWIGYSVNQDGKWDWSNPSASCFTYTNWGKTDLNDASRKCVLMGGNPNKVGEWGSASCRSRRPSICELGVKKDLCSAPDSNTAHYKPWGSWGRCTEPCGGGEQTRYRECQGPKELCERRINSDKRDCNMDACRFRKQSVDGVTYYETDDGMCLSDFSKEECAKIAKGLKAKHPKIVNKDTWFFPHGCYHSIKHNFVFYNEKPSTKRCDEERRCICRIALGKDQLIDWIYGDESVNPGKTTHLEPDYRAEMVEEKYVSDAVKKNQFTPGENLYELMDEM